MQSRLHSLPSRLWDKALAAADTQVGSAVRQRYFPEIWYAVENWLHDLRGRRVLELGLGLSLVSEALAQSGWQVTSLDPDAVALEQLQQRFAKKGLSGHVQRSGLGSLPYADGAFDAVISINSLEFTSSPLTTLRELKRVLAPTGRAVVATVNKRSPWGVPAVVQALKTPRATQEPLLLGRDEFLFLLESAGLKVTALRERGCYLPLALPLKMRLPITGAFVALISGPAAEARHRVPVPPRSGADLAAEDAEETQKIDLTQPPTKPPKKPPAAR